MTAFYDSAKIVEGYHYGFITPLQMREEVQTINNYRLIAEVYGYVMNKGESVQKMHEDRHVAN